MQNNFIEQADPTNTIVFMYLMVRIMLRLAEIFILTHHGIYH